MTAVPTDITAAVIICAYTMDRLTDIDKAVASVRNQTHRADELLIVVDHNDELLAEAALRFPDVRVIANAKTKGLSGARNTGVDATTSEIVVLLDDDAVAEPEWLAQIVAVFADPVIAIVGGRTIASWDDGRPAWFAPELDWMVGADYRGTPLRMHDIRNPFGCNCAWRRRVFERAGYFTEGLGRLGNDAAGTEETELSIRYARAAPGDRIVYVPTAVVHHRVTSGRSQWRYALKRCYAEGRSKARISRSIGAAQATGRESDYTLHVLAPAVARGVAAAVTRRDPAALLQPGAIIAALGVTGGGYVRQLAALSWRDVREALAR